MRYFTFIFLIIFNLSASIFTSPVFSQKIETKNGIRYIHDDKPKWEKEPKVKLEFILEFGGMDLDDENYIMSYIYDLCIDHKGRIWVTTYAKQPGPISIQNMDDIHFIRSGTKKENAVFEIFDKGGTLLGSLPQPCDIFIWRIFDDKLCVVGGDMVSVKVYRIIDLE